MNVAILFCTFLTYATRKLSLRTQHIITMNAIGYLALDVKTLSDNESARHPIILITGASRGIGPATALLVRAATLVLFAT